MINGLIFSVGVLLFIVIVLASMFWTAAKRAVKLQDEKEYTQEVYDELLEQNKEAFKHDFVDKGVKYLIFPVKSVYDHLDHQMAAFLHIVVRNQMEKFGDYNVDAEGKSLVVQDRAKNGRFV